MRLLLACVVLLTLPATALAAPDTRFWIGGMIESGDVHDSGLCDVVAPCPAFPLEVGEGGSRLRVAIDTPSREDSMSLELLDPSGEVAATADAANQFNAEAFVKDPVAGAWTVRVVPRGATQAFFRLRSKLERGEEAKPAGRVPLLPNLKSVPPYEFGFVAPANPANAAYPPDTVNPPLSAAGVAPASCAADEMAPAEAGGFDAQVCLRLTSGPINVGDGPFVKLFTFTEDAPMTRGPAVQRVYWSDGTTTERPAGTYSFHTTHAHFHDDNILTYELFRVVGDGLEPAGAGTKSGFCPADQLFGEWRRFTQAPAGDFGEGDSPTGNCFSPNDGTLALTRGWGDVYRWQRPGQYVEFGGNGDGRYVVRTTVDKFDTTLETNEHDNSAYALIDVVGRRVDVLERGQGLSHLDPGKEVFTGYGPASQDALGELPLVAGAAGAPPRAAAPALIRRPAPRISRARLRGRVLRFTLSAPASVRVTALRGRRVVLRRTVRGRRGANVVRLRGVRRGDRVALVARDAEGRYGRAVRAR